MAKQQVETATGKQSDNKDQKVALNSEQPKASTEVKVKPSKPKE